MASFGVGTAIVAFALATSPAPVVVDGGAIAGVRTGDVVAYAGVPFAAPPVGALRWRAPQPVVPWPGVAIAERPGPICMQRGFYPDDAPPEPMSEDCLTLQLWVPTSADTPLPVMVWIHGGGLSNGSGSTPLYAGDVLARERVIVVTINYRLGALGFLAHPELSRESAGGWSGNYGLLDQIAALQWVQRNIAAFGGDPSRVTVFGQSSGAISISALTTSPLAQGLFARAIAHSGGLFEPLELAPQHGLAGAEALGDDLAARLGATSLAALRALPADAIVDEAFTPTIVIDGHVLRESPFDAYAAGRAHGIDLLVGYNAGEGYDFLPAGPVTAGNLTARLREDFPPVLVSLLGPATPATDDDALAAYVALQGQLRFGWDMLAWARLHAAAGRGHSFVYHFAAVPPGEPGARHGAEMAYVFGHPGPTWSEADRALARAIVAAWTRFAATGDPNGAALPRWPEFSLDDERALLLGDEIHAGPLPDSAALAAIDRVYALARFVAHHLVAVAVGALVVVLGTLALLWRGLRWALRRRGVPARGRDGALTGRWSSPA